MIYEILIRGNSAGEIVGGHVIRFNESGGIGVAEEIPMVGTDLDFDGILPESLQNIVPLQELERRYNTELADYNTELADAKIKFDAALAEAKAEFDQEVKSLTQQLSEANHRIEQKDATIAQLQAQITELTAPKTPDWQRLALQYPDTEIGKLSRSIPEVDQTGLPLAIIAQNADATRSAFVDIVEQLGDRVSDADIDEVDRLFKDCGV